MDRRAWLESRRASAEASYGHGQGQGPMTETHQRFVQEVIDSSPQGGAILDAPCGTGRYFDLVLAAGRTVVGIDQSAGALAQARSRHHCVVLEQVTLQELAFEREFDGAMCIDAMEFISPEDWPAVLVNFRQAVRPGGVIYLTVEQIDSTEVARAFAETRGAGLPVLYGETGRGGYHHYPTTDLVSEWIAAAGLEIVREGVTRARTYGYLHLMLQEP